MTRLPARYKRDEFNCMSYALGNYDEWLVPKKNSRYLTEKEMTPQNFNNLVDFIEEEYNLKRIVNPADYPRNIRVIAFRIALHCDFHFLVRKNGVWRHKMGGQPDINIMKKEEVFSDSWCKIYKGEIAFFVSK